MSTANQNNLAGVKLLLCIIIVTMTGVTLLLFIIIVTMAGVMLLFIINIVTVTDRCHIDIGYCHHSDRLCAVTISIPMTDVMLFLSQ